jgi:GT2 family glycosyltransferase/2-polyprenyl-3-methyl-5-hydroxy-6-metoxy-1,4-benzoquinol methylase/Flp pilus assembly protein TadD/spore maturation protein CgeB
MQSLKILTFNWHDPYIYLFGQTAQEIHVCDWMRRADGTTGWDYEKRPLRANLQLVKDPAEAIAGLKAGDYDVAVAHTLQDIKFLNDYDIPAIYLTHNALHNDGMNNVVAMNQIRGMVAEFVDRPNRLFAAISQMKLNSWGLEGVIIPPGIDTADYGGYTGEQSTALAVGNLFIERDFMLGYSDLAAALEHLPHQYVGENPSMSDARKAENWEDLKSFYRSHRLYANATVEAFEDGYNLGMLEAMATGMPVVTMANATSPIVDGVNGYHCETTDQMHERISELLQDADRAKQLGEGARKTVEEDFSVEAFVENWMTALARCATSSSARTKKSSFRLDVTPGQMYAYDATDVTRFLSAPDQVTIAKAKIDRFAGAMMIDFVLVNTVTGEQAVWAGFLAQVNGDKLNAEFPPYLNALNASTKQQVEQVLIACVQEAMKPENAEVLQLHINLGEAESLVSRVGNDRITPGDVRADVYLHHAKRYGFASQFCEGKDVVDVASGTGYGSKILARHARGVLAMDLEADPLRYGRLTFNSENIRRANADMRALPAANSSADTIVCFEAIEHITEHSDFVQEVHRVLREDGQFVVSTPNLEVYGRPENDNPYHVGMLNESDFTDLLSEYFEDVVCVNQERASGNRNFYDYFNFTDDPNADKEIHIAVCSKPKRLSGRTGEQASGGERGSEKVATRIETNGLVSVLSTPEPVHSGKVDRLKILFAQTSNPVSAGRSYVDALRTAHDVMTCGTALDPGEMESWREAEKQHVLKRDNAGEVEKLDLMLRLVEPCDIAMEPGQVDVQNILSQLPEGWTPDLFIWADNGGAFLPIGMDQLNCPSVALIGDTHTGQMDWRIDYAKMFSNPYLMFTRHHLAEFQTAGVSNIGWLPAACDPRFHGKFDVAKSYEIGFIGQTSRQWHPDRVALLERLKEAGFDLQVDSKILEEMSLFHSRSKIVFNRSLNQDLNRRVFEAMCSGSMLLTDRLPAESGLETLFTDREHLALYDDANVEEIARYYLDHAEEREAIAAKGRELVLADHSYAARANQMLTEVIGSSAAICSDPCTQEVGVPVATAHDLSPKPIGSSANPLDEAIAELSAYTGESPDVIQSQMTSSGADLADEWRAGDRNTKAGVDDFYKQTDRYLYNLTRFNYGAMYQGWRGAIKNLCQQVSEAVGDRGFDVLDYGAGIGTNLIDVSGVSGARLHYADLPGKTFDYAQWRFGQRSLDVTALSADGEDALKGRQFDVIICMDVLEHVVDPEAAVRRLINHLNPGGLLVLTVTFYQNENGPYHLNCDKFTNESFYSLVEQCGMKEMSSFSPRVFQKTEVPAAVSNTPQTASPTANDPVFSTQSEIDTFLSRWDGPVRMNLGCGPDNRTGYINVDAYVDNADLKMDIFNLPLPDNSVDEILSSHMLEHLGKFEVPLALKEWFRVLKPTGKLQMNLPDLEWSARQWLDLPEDSRWGWPLDTLFGLQTHPGEYHKTGFTADRIEKVLRNVGFGGVQTSWSWSHGLRCIWVDATKVKAGAPVDAELDRFTGQFMTDLSDIVPYSESDSDAFFSGADWRVGFVSFEQLPMDGNIYTINVAIKQGDRQMILQCLRLFTADRDPVLWFPGYLQGTSGEVQAAIGEKVSAAFKAMVGDPAFKSGQFVFARFGEDGDIGLEKDGERVIPGLTDMSLYIPHIKRYLFAKTFCEEKRVLDAGCGAGYGSKLLSEVADSVHAVDIAEDALAFCQKTYQADNLSWERADVRKLDAAQGAYDVVTSFEVIEHLERDEIPEYLEGLQAALKDDGVALISTPNRLVAQQWDNPHHHTEMTREEFERTLSEYFNVEAVLGQVTWSPEREVSGQSYLTRRVTNDDDMFVAVCRPLPAPEPPSAGESTRARRSEVTSEIDDKRTLVPADRAQASVDVVIPLYNKAALTKACLESLEASQGEVSFRVILVDNGSTDETGDLLSDWADRATVVRPGENLGFSKGNNLGAKQGDSPYLLFLNNDTVAEAGWLDRLYEVIDASPEVGIVGPKLLYPNRKIQHAGLEIVNGVPDHVFRNAAEDDPQANVSRDLDMVTGACLMIRRDLFESMGGFDEAYVNGVEDIDLCLRTRDRGFRVRYVSESVLEHHEGMSEGRYDHVEPNLQKFAQRFMGRFDGQGRFLPVVDGETVDTRSQSALRGVWEGTQFVRHSLSIVNTAMANELLNDDRVELRLIPYEAPTFGPEEDPETYLPIAKALQHSLSGVPDFHVRHKWPPDLSAPASGHWIMFQPWEFGRIPQAWVEPIQNRVDEVWAYSFYVKQCYVDSGIDPDRVQVVPLGVDSERFTPDAPPIKLDTDKTFKFLFVGGTIYRKGIDVLLNAYQRSFTAKDDVCLVLKGVGEDTFYSGQTAGELIRQIQSDPNAPEILYLTEELSDDDIAGVYTACDCLVHPYRGEGFGMPVAEAMACDLPVIVTRGGSTDDFCVEDTAYFVEADRRDIAFNEETAGQTWLLEPQIDSLIEQMNLVIKHPEEAKEKGKLGGDHVRENLTWKQTSDRAVERLEAVCASPVRRTITLPGVRLSEPAPAVASGSVDCLILATESDERTLAGHALERYTSHDLNTRVIDAAGETPVGGLLNVALPELTTDVVLLLREDTIVTEGWLDALLAGFDQGEDVGIVVPSTPDGRGDQAVSARYRSKKKELQKFARKNKNRFAGQTCELDSVSSACVLIRRDLLVDLGGFEATFETDAFIDDLVRRAAQKGTRTVCVRDVFVHSETDSAIEEARERKAVRSLADGDVHRLNDEPEAALACYREALEHKSDYVEAVLICSAVLLEMERPEEAAEPFYALVEKHPNSARIQNYLGRCLFKAGQTDEARERFDRALDLMPQFAEARGNLAVLHWEQGRLDEAVEHMIKAAELAPNDPDTLFNIGMIYAQLGQSTEAIEALTSYLTVSPEDNNTRVHLAALLIDAGHETEGLEALEHVLGEDPEHEDAARVLRQLEVLVAANEGPQGL